MMKLFNCPSCGQINTNHIEVDDGCCWQPMTCDDCGATWENVYAFSSHVSLEVPEKEED